VKILALDTATENCSAALLIDGSMKAREIEMERGHAERILPMIDDLLSEAGITLQDLDAIAFGRGPGSFTGVRLAATVTQGLAFGAALGVVPVSDLQAVAQRAFGTDADLTRILVCNDARMSEVYWGCFELGEGGLARPVGDEHVSKPSAVALPKSWETAIGVGRGFTAYGDALCAAVPSLSPPPSGPHADSLYRLLPRAAEIVLLSVPEWAAGRLVAAEAAIPIYLRDNVVHVAQPPKSSGHAR
jgi:tRNA threonylcarbamoyladenosine biosynthesis protein TsaB